MWQEDDGVAIPSLARLQHNWKKPKQDKPYKLFTVKVKVIKMNTSTYTMHNLTAMLSLNAIAELVSEILLLNYKVVF